MLVIALIALIFGMLAHHLGLSEAIASVITKIAKCHKCFVFWTSLSLLAFCDYNILAAIGLSLVNAYLSNWVGLILMWLNRKYDIIWERLNR